MNTISKLAAATLAIALLAFGAHHFFGKEKKVADKGIEQPTKEKQPPAPKRAGSAEGPQPSMASMPTQIDDDPIGNMLLQGQVVDEEGRPVAGATVILGSAPTRTATSEEDGSFSFDKLVQRRYPVSARSSDRIGGPVVVTLSATSDPVLVRMRPGGGIRVEVVDLKDMPIASATVSIPALESVQGVTDSKGIVEIHNVPQGAALIAVEASGYAKAHSLATIPRGENTLGQQRIRLERGVRVSGRVVDDQGKAVASASIIALQSGAIMQVENPAKDGVKSDKQGKFVLPAVAAGSIQLLAVHDLHAPSTSERFEVGDSEVKDLTLTLRPGASVAGRVVNTSGEAVAWATVRVRNPEGSLTRGQGVNRQMISGEDGSFTIQGLPRDEVALYGASEAASSQSLKVDLRSTSAAKNLELVLDVEGTIAGIVVDEKGAAVAEAQVTAIPDFWEGADMQGMRVRGPSFATTGGDGKFVIRGLPTTKFKLSASRGTLNDGGGFRQGVSAKTGDDNVKVVLATPASIVGEIRANDGSTPAFATASIGWGKSVPVQKGRFHLSEVSPGSYEITVRGPDFATSFLADVEVEAGEKKDVGTITVRKGRKVFGRVVDSGGAPVSGAEIAMARQLISDGANLTPKNMGTAMDERMGTRRTTSDEKGAFSLRGIGDGEQTIAADHPEHGRSLGLIVAKGTEDVELDLPILPAGSVKGTITVNGQPSAGVDILLTSESGSAHIVIVKSDERGSFWAKRVASGKVKVSAMVGTGGGSSMVAVNVDVSPKEPAIADLEITEGSIAFAVQIKGVDDAKIDASQVFLFKGAADVHTGGELNKLFLSAASSAKMGFAMGQGAAKFDKVSPGSYSVCIIPINGDMNDPTFAQKLQRNVDGLAVYCQQLKITETPADQSFTAVVPPMNPLPDD